MKNYYIKCAVYVSIDYWNEGRGEDVNYWELNAHIKAASPLDAIKQFYAKELYWSFDEKLAFTDLQEIGENSLGCSNYVDVENTELEENSQAMQDFKAGKRTVYVADSRVQVFKMLPVAININH